jgi:hypothetical protein
MLSGSQAGASEPGSQLPARAFTTTAARRGTRAAMAARELAAAFMENAILSGGLVEESAG